MPHVESLQTLLQQWGVPNANRVSHKWRAAHLAARSHDEPGHSRERGASQPSHTAGAAPPLPPPAPARGVRLHVLEA